MLKRTVALGTAAAVALLSITALSSCKKDGGTPETTGAMTKNMSVGSLLQLSSKTPPTHVRSGA